jgi:hypothetical protein
VVIPAEWDAPLHLQADVGGEVLGEETADLVPEGDVLGAESDVHA